MRFEAACIRASLKWPRDVPVFEFDGSRIKGRLKLFLGSAVTYIHRDDFNEKLLGNRNEVKGNGEASFRTSISPTETISLDDERNDCSEPTSLRHVTWG